MKLSHPIAIKSAALLGAGVISAWMRTLDYRFAVDDPAAHPDVLGERGLYLFWHETLLLPAYAHVRDGFAVLVSTHRDGELIAQTVRLLGGRAIRGSSTRGGTAAVIAMLRDRRSRHLAITPDGPRGPRRVIQDGAIYLASRGRMPLVPVGYAVSDAWRAPSWDRMILPKPGAAARAVAGAPIRVPAGAAREELQTYRQRVQDAMDDVQARAEDLAARRAVGPALLTLRQVRGGGE
ncbi:MAG: lysophospholipid acyltransferase family protein [Planctomycetes bacterium]|nr:lysophospholipid acyltransferase family protein [Planctomycetota bacterium]